jgi:hypothetical protein
MSIELQDELLTDHAGRAKDADVNLWHSIVYTTVFELWALGFGIRDLASTPEIA